MLQGREECKGVCKSAREVWQGSGRMGGGGRMPECKRGMERAGDKLGKIWSNVQGQEEDRARVCESGLVRVREEHKVCRSVREARQEPARMCKDEWSCKRGTASVEEGVQEWLVWHKDRRARTECADGGDLSQWLATFPAGSPLGKVANSDPVIAVYFNCNSN